MSWIVQTLLRDRYKIKQNPDFDSDEYLDILLIESKISSLRKEGVLSQRDLNILYGISDGMALKDLGKLIGKTDNTVYKYFVSLCGVIGYSLGDQFTDEGYLEMMREKYDLSPEQLIVMQNYMNSKHKYRLVRNPKL